ncbi:MAG: microcin ABC transporter permease [Rhodobiaceae bacterium]|nr:MAG: microcin ABC transporter permease [Rhodobiaceae bacterium]
MTRYVGWRIMLMIPTLFGIMLLNFALTQMAPGGPIEQLIAEAAGSNNGIMSRVGDEGDVDTPSFGESQSFYRGADQLDPAFIAELEKEFGFDKPPAERFINMMWRYLRFDFGESFFRGGDVISLTVERLPVSITLGLWATLIAYWVSIPLGIAKAVRDGSPFDFWTSGVIFVGYAIPSFVIAILLILIFSSGTFFDWFPLRGLVGEGWRDWPLHEQIGSYIWHTTLPVLAMVLGSFAFLTMLTKNSFLDQLSQHYVLTARAKGLTEKKVLYGHVFRNAMLIVIAGLPGTLIGILFTGVLMIEVIFSLDGLGLLAFEAALARDYPIVFGALYLTTLLGLFLRLISDLVYTMVDPRIDFESLHV